VTETFPVPEDPPYVLFVGRLAPWKGTVDFVRCVAMLPRPIRGIIIGEGTAENCELIRRVARETGNEDRVDLLPWKGRDDVARLMSAASVTVFPSTWEEPFGLVGIESQALGVPVVAYAHGGVSDWLENDVTGLSVAPGDVAGLAACAGRIIDDQDLRSRIVRSAAERVSLKFSRPGHLQRLVGHYRAAIGGGRS
jgi:glycogen(starch) synthase